MATDTELKDLVNKQVEAVLAEMRLILIIAFTENAMATLQKASSIMHETITKTTATTKGEPNDVDTVQ